MRFKTVISFLHLSHLDFSKTLIFSECLKTEAEIKEPIEAPIKKIKKYVKGWEKDLKKKLKKSSIYIYPHLRRTLSSGSI